MLIHEDIRNVLVQPTRLLSVHALSSSSLIECDLTWIDRIFRYYSETLLRTQRAKHFLESRCIHSDEIIKHFRLGFSDRSLGKEIQKLDCQQEAKLRGALQRLGLYKSTGHELFRGSLVFPFQDADGTITGAYGRRVTPKLSARSVYHVHWVSERTTFFNCSILSKYSSIILCKSPLEAITWIVKGYSNVVSLMGFGRFGKCHTECLIENGVKRVFIAFGTTSEALVASQKISRTLRNCGIESRLVIFPNGMDTNHFVLTSENPHTALSKLLDSALYVHAPS